VGPQNGVQPKANPSELMSQCSPLSLVSYAKNVLAVIRDLRRYTPADRDVEIKKESEKDCWQIEEVFKKIAQQLLID